MLAQLAHIQSIDVIRPMATHGGMRLSCVTRPDAPQVALLDRLGIVLPSRMRINDHLDLPIAVTA